MNNDWSSTRILAAVKELLAERFDVSRDVMTDDASIRDLGLDSMLVLDVMLEMEDRLGIKLANMAIPANPTLRDIATIIERNLAAHASP